MNDARITALRKVLSRAIEGETKLKIISTCATPANVFPIHLTRLHHLFKTASKSNPELEKAWNENLKKVIKKNTKNTRKT